MREARITENQQEWPEPVIAGDPTVTPPAEPGEPFTVKFWVGSLRNRRFLLRLGEALRELSNDEEVAISLAPQGYSCEMSMMTTEVAQLDYATLLATIHRASARFKQTDIPELQKLDGERNRNRALAEQAQRRLMPS